MIVRDIAYCRAGDKGDTSNVVVVAHDDDAYEVLRRELTLARVERQFQPVVAGPIERFEMPGIRALNFVMYQALAGGVSRSLALDPHGKSRASLMLAISLE
jgi:hypothetical protein